MEPITTLVATMAGGPQIVTFALDVLLAQGEPVVEVVAVHLSPQADPLTAQALQRLAAEFSAGSYCGRPCRLEYYPLRSGEHKLADIRDEADANAAWHALYELIAELKIQGRRLHVCVAGGRRMLALLATSAAMLHFDHADRLWHMYTPNAFLEQARNGAVMHAQPADGVRLIQVPVVPWGAYFPGLRSLAQQSVSGVLATYERQLDAAERRRCAAVARRLTERQREVLFAFAAGSAPQDVAEALHVSLKTVDSHKTVILAECRSAWELDPEEWLDYHFIRDRFRHFDHNTEPGATHQKDL